MALRFVFDMVEGSYIRNTIHGLEICRRTRVYDLPVSAIGTAHLALTNILRDPQCPRLTRAHPDPQTGAYLEEHRLVSVEKPKRYADLDLIYRSVAIDGSQQVAWTVEDSSISDHVLTNRTANGMASLSVWYKANEPDTTTAAPNGATIIGATVHRIVVNRVIRVTGRATRQQWISIRNNIRAARGKIHSDSWGGYQRGTWLFFGPHTFTSDRGNNYSISLEFAERENGWYPVEIYRDEQGRIPKDLATEGALRQSGPPGLGTYKGRNGIVIASVQGETSFSNLFAFTPDEEPNPP